MDGLFDGFTLEWRDDRNGGPLVRGYRYVRGSDDRIKRTIWRDGTYKDERIDASTGVESIETVFVVHHPRVVAV